MKYLSPITDYIRRSTYVRSTFFQPQDGTNRWPNGFALIGTGDYTTFVFAIPSEINQILDFYIVFYGYLTRSTPQLDLLFRVGSDTEVFNRYAYDAQYSFVGTALASHMYKFRIMDQLKDNCLPGDNIYFNSSKQVAADDFSGVVRGLLISYTV